MSRIKYISRIKDEFDSVICGVNGVFMSGSEANPVCIDALIKLYQDGKKIALASNSALRVRDLYYDLKRCGVPMNIFYAMITAGEIAHFYLRKHQGQGRSYYSLSSFDSNIMDGLGYAKTDSIVMADFILAQTDSNGLDEEEIMPVLEQALHLNLPMICVGSNTMLVGKGGIVSGAGEIAERYAMMGGKNVIPFGKPDVRIASYLTEGMPGFSKERCLVIGDGMSTDIRMADSFGVKSLFITDGVHRLRQASDAAISELAASYGVNVDYFTETLQW